MLEALKILTGNFRNLTDPALGGLEFFKSVYDLPGQPHITRAGIIAHPESKGNNEEPEPQIAEDVFKFGKYPATVGKNQGRNVPFKFALQEVIVSKDHGTIGFFTESDDPGEAREATEAFARALEARGCNEESDNLDGSDQPFRWPEFPLY